ncbi:hypothetical protein HRG_002974 [Hirsutella rhossiliensis]|uniref:Uncharacterized protein n=1 Tax=Hirsutella rhossiliensis TaxID=111463 RepID=A0A9P8MYW9_9HYPO|nr:uncharacterized protein HRG_02974 [Hirsutella rhossiliensis]KAH0964958.1 hypothetical protein HRG_02974 [Hirsutella rhossiliensis]
MDDHHLQRKQSSSVDDASALHAILDTAALVARALWRLPWAASLARLARLAALPLGLLAWPLSCLAAVLRILFAPALHVAAYLLSWGRAVVALIASLEPLYTFFSVAAAIGIVSGVILGLSSSIITTYLGMYDDPETDDRPSDKLTGYDKRLPAPGPASWEADWHWTESSTSRFRQPSGLLSQTIHEEEDDSDP